MHDETCYKFFWSWARVFANFPVSGEEEVGDECRKKLRQQMIKSSQHG